MSFDHDGLRSYTYMLVWRGLKDIEGDTVRQLRSYADMGSMLARSPGQRFFFSRAQELLKNKDSDYFKLIKRILQQTDREQLCTLGVNIGISSLAYGAGKLRQEAEKTGQPQCWLHVYTLANAQQVAELEQQVAAAEEAGCYSYIVQCPDEETVLGTIDTVCTAHEKSAFFIRVRPEMVTERLVQAQALNALWVLEVDGREVQQAQTAARLLQEAGRVYTLEMMVPEDKVEEYMGPTMQQKLAKMAYCCVLHLPQSADAASAERLKQLTYQSRVGQPMPLLLFDWDSDLESIREMISPQMTVCTKTL